MVVGQGLEIGLVVVAFVDREPLKIDLDQTTVVVVVAEAAVETAAGLVGECCTIGNGKIKF